DAVGGIGELGVVQLVREALERLQRLRVDLKQVRAVGVDVLQQRRHANVERVRRLEEQRGASTVLAVVVEIMQPQRAGQDREGAQEYRIIAGGVDEAAFLVIEPAGAKRERRIHRN